MKKGDVVRSKTMRRLGGAIRSRLEEYRNFEGLGVILNVSQGKSKKGSFARVMLPGGEVVTVKTESLDLAFD